MPQASASTITRPTRFWPLNRKEEGRRVAQEVVLRVLTYLTDQLDAPTLEEGSTVLV